MKDRKKLIYVAGAISDAPQWILEWHHRLGVELRRAGFETYVPHEDEEFADSRVFARDVKKMAEADLILATVSFPSTGTGIEIALAPTKVMLVHHPEEPLSPMVLGFAKARGHPILSYTNATLIAQLVKGYLG